MYGLHHLGLSQYSSSTVPLFCQRRGCRGWAHPTRPAHSRDPLWINGFGFPLRFVLASASACADCATAHSASGLGSSMPRLHRDWDVAENTHAGRGADLAAAPFGHERAGGRVGCCVRRAGLPAACMIVCGAGGHRAVQCVCAEDVVGLPITRPRGTAPSFLPLAVSDATPKATTYSVRDPGCDGPRLIVMRCNPLRHVVLCCALSDATGRGSL